MPRRKLKSNRAPTVLIKSCNPNKKTTSLSHVNKSNADDEPLNTLTSIAFRFPLVTQKVLLHLHHADLKHLRQTNSKLKSAVDHYIGLDFALSESLAFNTDAILRKVQILDREKLTFFKKTGIRSLAGVNLAATKFFELITHPYLLRDVQLIGRVDQTTILGILKECHNLESLKLKEPSAYQKLIHGNVMLFINSISDFVKRNNRQGTLRLDKLKCLHIYCSTTSTMGFILIILSLLEARNLVDFEFCVGPIHPNFYALISGLVVHVMNQATTTLKKLSLVLESGESYDEQAAKRRFLRKLYTLENISKRLPTFHETFEKLNLSDEDRDEWLKRILTEAGTQTQLATLRVYIDTMEDFANNWSHFVKCQRCLRVLEVQTCCNWQLLENVIKNNCKNLEKLSVIMEFSRWRVDMQDLFRDCLNLKYLTMKNYLEHEFRLLDLGERREGHTRNAKFDKLFPNLEGLALSDLLISCVDIGSITELKRLKNLMLTWSDFNFNTDCEDPSRMFGLMHEDFLKLLHHRTLNYLIVSNELLVCCGSDEKRMVDADRLEDLLQDNMFHQSNLLGPNSSVIIDEEHVAVAHGDPITISDWFLPCLLSVVEDPVVTDRFYTRSIIEDREA